MRKLLSIGGGVLLILSFLTATVNAKSLPAISIPPITNDLSDQLAADKDFRDFSFLIYEFTGKVQATKSGRLLLNYFEHKTTAEESSALFSKLEFTSKEGFNEYWKKTYRLKENFQTKFGDLFKMVDVKAIVEMAAQKVAIEKEFSKISKYPTSYCWDILCAQLSACAILICNGAYDYTACMEACVAIAITGSGACYLFAD